jgi:hypothetical protein
MFVSFLLFKITKCFIRKYELLIFSNINISNCSDIRARLELAINRVCDLARVEETIGGCDSDDSDWGPGYDGGEELTKVVRKELASVLRDLMQHGLCQVLSIIFSIFCTRLSKVNTVAKKSAIFWSIALTKL